MEIKQSASENSLKNHRQPQIPKYYYVGSRRAQVLHTGLRTNCSSLNLHLFLKNFTDSPLCLCGSIENTEHFFLYCMYYQDQRDELLSFVTPYQVPTVFVFYGNTQIQLYSSLFQIHHWNETFLRPNSHSLLPFSLYTCTTLDGLSLAVSLSAHPSLLCSIVYSM